MPRLYRSDLVGKQITSVWEVESEPIDDDWIAVRPLFELDHAAVIDLSTANSEEAAPLLQLSDDERNRLCTDSHTAGPLLSPCIGDKIAEVVISELWPGPGFLLSTASLIYGEIFLAHKVVRAVHTLLSEFDEVERDEVVTYWGRQPLWPRMNE